jgi:formylmethanofuran dehydrogenase subunit E
MSPDLSTLLERSSERHSHLCPRQVLGVRMGLAGLTALGLTAPVNRQTALLIAETDGCFADGVEIATGATIGHRTLRINDLGKIALTVADTNTGRTLRISPALDLRQRALAYAPDEHRHYFAQLLAYQVMPETEMFRCQEVSLSPGLRALISKPNVRVLCDACGEEIINERQVYRDGRTKCRACAGEGYYLLEPAAIEFCAIMDYETTP